MHALFKCNGKFITLNLEYSCNGTGRGRLPRNVYVFIDALKVAADTHGNNSNGWRIDFGSDKLMYSINLTVLYSNWP